MGRLRVKLRLGIAATFLSLAVPLTAIMIAALFQQNVTLARRMADQAMERATREVATTVSALFGNLSGAVGMSVSFGRALQEGARQPDALRPMFEMLQRIPEAYSIYFGTHDDGGFYQVVRLPEAISAFGPYRRKPPEDARWVVRILDSSSGERRDTYVYLRDWGDVVRVERAESAYDPRARPWYQNALADDRVVNSGAYVFSGTGRPGLTLSQRLVTDDGTRVGVFGADLSIDALGEFLAGRGIGAGGVTFILDEDLRLVGFPDAAKAVTIVDGKVVLVDGAQVDHPVVSEAVRAHRAGGGLSLLVDSKADGSTWLAGFRPFPDQFGRRWTIGAIAAEDEFVGAIKEARRNIILLGAAFMVVATLGVVWLSYLLSRPIDRLIAETERIRRFELEGKVEVSSPIQEMAMLAAAVGSMKAGLASFGSYVPKSLVEDIIRSGSGTKVGGVRRPLTIMFSDLQGFTSATESMEPEQLLHWLSEYFDAMSKAVHDNRGTIDKFIGDAVMAMWNAPLEDDDHVANACRAMLACRRVCHAGGTGGPALKTRMGLHTGIAVVGNVGSHDRMQYTALGAVVNLASRVESLNKQLGTELLVTGPVAAAVGDRFLLRPFGPVLVVGASIPLEVCELVGEAGEAAPGLDIWNAAMAAYRAGRWDEAVAGFEAYSAGRGEDPAASLLAGNARRFAQSGAPSDWDGVLRFTKK
ncbi:adenylate/guanylate cyclase domain-containing protein [Magnetospirillum sp. UT-4]|uniref:adenylate/guanylate cyclase domain-containing protein n=1 Tax=Magnetospirillum sp. UT-4 TaxID=2681467 RepID=UPI0013833AF3|nr:adenylate/guanylate cyclase domain-containing protein [Magnetospirillum sp. UT-4]CAA7620383.1 Adenylate cyclase 1 protein [Magnetospirillum sp. UT-4]